MAALFANMPRHTLGDYRMRMKLIVTVALIGCVLTVGWYVAAQDASDDLPTFVAGQVLTAAELNAIVEAVRNNTAAIDPTPQTLSVNCDAGDTLGEALTQIKAGDTINVTGTCTETVTITTDQLTLVGQEGATLDGGGAALLPVVMVDGARGTTFRGFTVQNADVGIAVINGAVVTLEGTQVQDNATSGLAAVANGVLLMFNVSVQNNGIGVTLSSGGVGRFAGVSVVRDNTRQGILVANGTINFLLGAPQRELRVLNNGAHGLKFIAGRGSFFGGTLVADGNTADGVLLQHSSAVVKGSEGFPVVGTVSTSGNGGNGILVESGSDFSVDINLTTLTDQNNSLAGLRLDDGSASIGAADFTGNTTFDVQLTFQSKLTLTGGNTVGSFDIDATSVCRDLSGQGLCP
jgi:hypothetical protein